MGTQRGRMLLGGQLIVLSFMLILIAPHNTMVTTIMIYASWVIRMAGFALLLVFNTPVPLTVDRRVDMSRDEKPTVLDTLAYDLARLPQKVYTVASFLRECARVLLFATSLVLAITYSTPYSHYVMVAGTALILLAFISSLVAFSAPETEEETASKGGERCSS
jgi:hypothetical protein